MFRNGGNYNEEGKSGKQQIHKKIVFATLANLSASGSFKYAEPIFGADLIFMKMWP